MSSPQMLKLSAMHHRLLDMGAAMIGSDGWQVPARYTTADQELEQLRRTVGLCDISPTEKLSLQGTELESVLKDELADLVRLDVGEVRRASRPDLPSVLVAQLALDEIMVLGSRDEASSILAGLGDLCAHAVDITSALAGVSIAGPSAHLVLAGITDLDVSEEALPHMSCAQGMFVKIHGTLLRVDLAGLPNYELYFGREFGEYVWNALLDVGEQHEVTAFGTEAMTRLQAGG